MTRADYLRREYEGRVNRAIDFVYANFSRDFDLDELADAAAFSRFHFHRVFHALTGETLAGFVRRVRLARSADLLRSAPGLDVTQVALECGFSGPSVFSRAFRDRYGCSPSEWRSGDFPAPRSARDESKQGQADGKGGDAGGPETGYPSSIERPLRREPVTKLKYEVEVKELPELTVAYARHVGPYNEVGEAFGRLGRWAGPRGLFRPGALSLAVYHDSPETTEAAKLRSSACLSVPPGTPVDGDIGLMSIPGGTFAVGRFEIAADQFGEAWDALMGEWLPASGWQPDDRPCYEVYLNDHEQHPQKHFIIDICQPVKPL
ncbi:MAG: AraC family transcriptional regulator [Spirochaetia bacterium]|nr:AraC family transcriptional regulator [Spirochaetia bacterium]